MANDWIKMRTNLAEDPAVYGIAGATKLTRPAVVGSLHILWAWADGHTTDGVMTGITDSDIDDKVGRRGFAAGMAKFGWLIIESDGVRFPNFSRHNGESAKLRVMETEKKRLQRLGQNGDADHLRSGNPVPKKSGQCPDETGTREDKSIQQQQRRLISVSEFPDLARQFPGVDLHAELAKARTYVRQQRGPTAEVEFGFFSEIWLPKSPVTIAKNQASAETAEAPEGWRAAIAETNYGPEGNFPASAWSELPAHVQAHVRETLKATSA